MTFWYSSLRLAHQANTVRTRSRPRDQRVHLGAGVVEGERRPRRGRDARTAA